MRYYMGPWELRDDVDGPCFHAPDGTVGLVDLRGDCTRAGFGFFATERELGSDYLVLGTQLDEPVKPELADRWASALSVDRLYGSTVLACLVELLGPRADPEGGVGAKPLLPNHLGVLELYLGGHSRVWHRRFQGVNDPCWPNIQAVLQADYRKVRAAALAARSQDTTVHQRLLATWQRKYGIADVGAFIPGGLPKELPLSPDTSAAESFKKADEPTLGPDLSWTEFTSTGAADSIQVKNNTFTSLKDGLWNFGRADFPASIDDLTAQVDVLTLVRPSSGAARVGANCRMSPETASNQFDNYGAYLVRGAGQSTDKLHLVKWVDGAFTLLVEDATLTFSLPDTVMVKAVGSTITGWFNGTQRAEVTDTAIAGNLQCGVFCFIHTSGNNYESTGDNFLAEDLVPPPTGFAGRLLKGAPGCRTLFGGLIHA